MAIVWLKVRIDVDVAIFGIHRPVQPRAVVHVAIGEFDGHRVDRLGVQQLLVVSDVYPVLSECHLGQRHLGAIYEYLVNLLAMKVEEEVCAQCIPGHLRLAAALTKGAQVELNLCSSHEEGGVSSLLTDIQ